MLFGLLLLFQGFCVPVSKEEVCSEVELIVEDFLELMYKELAVMLSSKDPTMMPVGLVE